MTHLSKLGHTVANSILDSVPVHWFFHWWPFAVHFAMKCAGLKMCLPTFEHSSHSAVLSPLALGLGRIWWPFWLTEDSRSNAMWLLSPGHQWWLSFSCALEHSPSKPPISTWASQITWDRHAATKSKLSHTETPRREAWRLREERCHPHSSCPNPGLVLQETWNPFVWNSLPDIAPFPFLHIPWAPTMCQSLY